MWELRSPQQGTAEPDLRMPFLIDGSFPPAKSSEHGFRVSGFLGTCWLVRSLGASGCKKKLVPRGDRNVMNETWKQQ